MDSVRSDEARGYNPQNGPRGQFLVGKKEGLPGEAAAESQSNVPSFEPLVSVNFPLCYHAKCITAACQTRRRHWRVVFGISSRGGRNEDTGEVRHPPFFVSASQAFLTRVRMQEGDGESWAGVRRHGVCLNSHGRSLPAANGAHDRQF